MGTGGPGIQERVLGHWERLQVSTLRESWYHSRPQGESILSWELQGNFIFLFTCATKEWSEWISAMFTIDFFYPCLMAAIQGDGS